MSYDDDTGSSASYSSYDGSATSSFDPEQEAMSSTRRVDESPRLPQNNSTIRRRQYGQKEPDYEIDTSTVEGALPPFSQVQTSEEDEEYEDDEDVSVEVGRGHVAPREDDTRSSIMSIHSRVRSSSPAIRVDYPPQRTSPKSRNTSRRAVSENLRKDAQKRQAKLANRNASEPQPPKGRQNNQRQTLSDMHARVRDTYEGSVVEDERPVSPIITARRSRFGSNVAMKVNNAVDQASEDPWAKMVREIEKSRALKQRASVANNTPAPGDTVTQQSIAIPDFLPLSEPTQNEQLTPTRRNKVRTTRFVSPPRDVDVSVSRVNVAADSVGVPDDEKVMFSSLKMLQDQFSELELAGGKADKNVQELRQEMAALKAAIYGLRDQQERQPARGKRASRRGGRTNEMGDDETRSTSSSVSSTRSDTQIAIEQLRRENAALKAAMSSRENGHEHSGKPTKPDDDDTHSSLFNIKIPRPGEWAEKPAAKPVARAGDDTHSSLFDIKLSKPIVQGYDKEARERAAPMAPMPARTDGEQRRASGPGNSRKSPAMDEDHTGLSVVNESELAKLRKRLEARRFDCWQGPMGMDDITQDTSDSTQHSFQSDTRGQSMKDDKKSSARRASANDTAKSTDRGVQPASRRSSREDAHVRPASAGEDMTASSRGSMTEEIDKPPARRERRRRHSDHSVSSKTHRRRHQSKEDMTSGFIVPDITIRHADVDAEDTDNLSESAQRALDEVAKHQGANCTVCKRVHPDDYTCNHIVNVPTPIPVSDRIPEREAYEEDHTLRPAQEPGTALASVLKALEDEHVHLKMKLAACQNAYYKVDPSMEKRKRKSLRKKMEQLLNDTDMKADQIYALYDVLEGQKKSRRQMTEREMDETLQSIGIDVGPYPQPTNNTHHPQSESEDELPWEGIESTADLSRRH